MKQLLFLCMCFSVFNCSKVPAGNVGIKYYLLGKSKGVDYEELGPGRYWIGYNEELYLFPTFTQTKTWTRDKNEDSPINQEIKFQTKEGLSVSADIGITFRVDGSKASNVFQKYKRGVVEIRDKFLRNMVRDAFVECASTKPIESVYGTGKADLMKEVNASVRNQCDSIGLVIEKIYLVGDMRLPSSVIQALNRKIEATQRAQQRENELREAEAEAKKRIAEAKGIAESELLKAQAKAKANKIIKSSISKELVQYKQIERWNGELPKFTGGAIPLISFQ